MSAFSTANLPATITTLERGFVWFGGALYHLHANSLYQQSDLTGLVPRFTSQIGMAADKREYLIINGSIPMPSDWRTSTLPLFAIAQEIADTPIPSGYLPV